MIPLIIINNVLQQAQPLSCCCGGFSVNFAVPGFCPLTIVGSESNVSDILSHMMSTSRSNTCLTFTLSLALVSKNSSPSWSASCLPLSYDTTLSSSMSHLLPTSITWAFDQEYVFTCVDLKDNNINYKKTNKPTNDHAYYNVNIFKISEQSLTLEVQVLEIKQAGSNYWPFLIILWSWIWHYQWQIPPKKREGFKLKVFVRKSSSFTNMKEV